MVVDVRRRRIAGGGDGVAALKSIVAEANGETYSSRRRVDSHLPLLSVPAAFLTRRRLERGANQPPGDSLLPPLSGRLREACKTGFGHHHGKEAYFAG